MQRNPVGKALVLFAGAAESRMIMEKKKKQQIKTCSDCIHEYACRIWTAGRFISADSASVCQNHETVKESAAYLCGVLDERKREKTNADRIRAMSDEEMADMLWKTGRNYRAVCADPVVDYNEHRDNLIAWLKQPPKGE